MMSLFVAFWQRNRTSTLLQKSRTNCYRQWHGLSIIRDIASSIRDAKYFTVMADEMTDASNREQVVECFRWVGCDFEPHEDFVGLHKVDKVNADTLHSNSGL